MASEQKEKVQFWLNRAKETLEDTQIAFTLGRHHMAMNRAYYAFFYAVMALGLSEGFITSKHSELRGWFNKTFIKTGVFPLNVGKVYSKLYEGRMESDYATLYSPTKEELSEEIPHLEACILTIENYINKK